jgi:methylenetetrahydrofolate dehydrogenase (NADP+)/methenyltetrahydrofolate cyclohydrolase
MIIDGRAIAQRILVDSKLRVEKLQSEQNITPHLAVVRVGEDQATTSYVNQKVKTAEKIGLKVRVDAYPKQVTQKELLNHLQQLDKDTHVHGIILQLPIPEHLNEHELLFTINPEKDVDGFHPHTKFPVPVAAAVLEIIRDVFTRSLLAQDAPISTWLKQQHIVVIGKGKTGGQPIIDILKRHGISPEIIDSKTKNPTAITKTADIIIAAVGKKNILTKDMIKPGVILICVGMGKDVNGNFFADYNQDEIQDIAGWYTPTPGGVGPVNVAKLMENVVLAAENTLQKY